MPQHAGILIIGASQAGVQLAISLRDQGYGESITIVGAEPHAPYQRPPLSKSYLSGAETTETLAFREPDYYASRDILIEVGQRIISVETRVDGSGIARTATGKEYSFGRLALTTGARPRKLQLPGADQAGIVSLRDAADADEITRRVRHAENVVVIGGGFIGLEVAAGVQQMGKRVTVLEAAPRLIGRAVGEPTSDFFLQAHRERGVHVILNAAISGFRGESGDVTGVELQDGAVVPADLVLVGIGVVPRTELAEQLGLTIGNGIVVDEHSLTSDGVTVAVGDCAEIPNPMNGHRGPERIRLESVNNAVEQAKNAAATIVGNPHPYRMVPWFWSDQGDIKLQMVGLTAGYDTIVTRGSVGDGTFSFFYLSEGRVIAADCVNSPADFAAAKRILVGAIPVSADHLIDGASPLRQVISDLTTATTTATVA